VDEAKKPLFIVRGQIGTGNTTRLNTISQTSKAGGRYAVTPSPALAMHETRLNVSSIRSHTRLRKSSQSFAPTLLGSLKQSLVFWIVPLRNRRADFSWNLFVKYPGFSVRLVAKLNFSHDRLLDFALMVERHPDNVTAARGRVRRVLSQRARQSGKRGSERTPQRSRY